MKLMRRTRRWELSALFWACLPAVLSAAPFSSPNNLVLMRLGDVTSTPGTAQPVYLDEYDVSGSSATSVQSLPIAASGGLALTMSPFNSHDGLLNKSVDGQYLVFAGYRANAGATDPTLDTATTTPRVIARVSAGGTADTTTALTDSFNQTSVRAVATDTGDRFWVVGDNADANPGSATTGGLRYVANLGATTSTNLSQVQTFSPPPTPDNVRSIGIFDGQLYESSGSSSSIGKAVFQVGTGLPTTDPQSLITLTKDGASTNAFFFADLSPTVPGIDTLYTSASAAGIGIHKYTKTCAADPCTWTSNNFLSLPGVEAMTAAVSGTTVTLYATDGATLFRLVDSTGYNANLAGSFSPILSAQPNQSFRGLAFAPAATVVTGDYNHNGIVDAADYTVWRDSLGAIGAGLAADGDHNNHIEINDYAIWKSHFGATSGGAGAVSGPSAAPEPGSSALAAMALLFGSILGRIRRVSIRQVCAKS